MSRTPVPPQDPATVTVASPEAVIQAFAERYGEAHLRLAYHAAFPVSLTSDLLYKIWINIQNEFPGELDPIPWESVSDFLVASGFCKMVGHDLYEVDPRLRQALLRELEVDPRFGDARIQQLAKFTLDYAEAKCHSTDSIQQDYAQVQRWGALAYSQPKRAAQELAKALAHAYREDEADLNRLAMVVLNLTDPLKSYPALLAYAQSMALCARGDEANAAAYLRDFFAAGNSATSRKSLINAPAIQSYLGNKNLPSQRMRQFIRVSAAWLGLALAVIGSRLLLSAPLVTELHRKIQEIKPYDQNTENLDAREPTSTIYERTDETNGSIVDDPELKSPSSANDESVDSSSQNPIVTANTELHAASSGEDLDEGESSIERDVSREGSESELSDSDSNNTSNAEGFSNDPELESPLPENNEFTERSLQNPIVTADSGSDTIPPEESLDEDESFERGLSRERSESEVPESGSNNISNVEGSNLSEALLNSQSPNTDIPADLQAPMSQANLSPNERVNAIRVRLTRLERRIRSIESRASIDLTPTSATNFESSGSVLVDDVEVEINRINQALATLTEDLQLEASLQSEIFSFNRSMDDLEARFISSTIRCLGSGDRIIRVIRTSNVRCRR